MQLLAERHIIKSTEHRFVEIDKLAFQSQNLYNAANYVIRQSLSMDGVTLITTK
jgi:putative transposase